MKQSLILIHDKKGFCISSELYGLEVKFWCGKDGFKTDEEIIFSKGKIIKEFFTKNDCFHKVKELRRGLSRENQKLINVF